LLNKIKLARKARGLLGGVRQKMLKKQERRGQYKNKKNYVKDVLHTYISDW